MSAERDMLRYERDGLGWRLARLRDALREITARKPSIPWLMAMDRAREALKLDDEEQRAMAAREVGATGNVDARPARSGTTPPQLVAAVRHLLAMLDEWERSDMSAPTREAAKSVRAALDEHGAAATEGPRPRCEMAPNGHRRCDRAAMWKVTSGTTGNWVFTCLGCKDSMLAEHPSMTAASLEVT